MSVTDLSTPEAEAPQKSKKTLLVVAVVALLFIGFGIFSVGFWSYFRFRHQPVVPT